MASSIQIKRGTTAKVAAYTPLEGELVLDLTTKKLYAGDGSTAGGNQIVASRKGVTDGNSAPAGEIGEVLTATTSTPVSITSGAAANAISISLTPGDWELTGMVRVNPSDAAITIVSGSWNTTSATFAGFPNTTQIQGLSAGGINQIPLPTKRYNVSTNTTVYLVGLALFNSGTCTLQGFISARRTR